LAVVDATGVALVQVVDAASGELGERARGAGLDAVGTASKPSVYLRI
jgi:hypothetical protein